MVGRERRERKRGRERGDVMDRRDLVVTRVVRGGVTAAYLKGQNC